MKAKRQRRWRRCVEDGDDNNSEGCGSSSDVDEKAGFSLRDRVCVELRDLQVFVFYLPA